MMSPLELNAVQLVNEYEHIATEYATAPRVEQMAALFPRLQDLRREIARRMQLVECPRCHFRPRGVTAYDEGDGETKTTLRKWCEYCLGTP